MSRILYSILVCRVGSFLIRVFTRAPTCDTVGDRGVRRSSHNYPGLKQTRMIVLTHRRQCRTSQTSLLLQLQSASLPLVQVIYATQISGCWYSLQMFFSSGDLGCKLRTIIGGKNPSAPDTDTIKPSSFYAGPLSLSTLNKTNVGRINDETDIHSSSSQLNCFQHLRLGKCKPLSWGHSISHWGWIVQG